MVMPAGARNQEYTNGDVKIAVKTEPLITFPSANKAAWPSLDGDRHRVRRASLDILPNVGQSASAADLFRNELLEESLHAPEPKELPKKNAELQEFTQKLEDSYELIMVLPWALKARSL